MLTQTVYEQRRSAAIQQIAFLTDVSTSIENNDVRRFIEYAVATGSTYLKELERQQDAELIIERPPYYSGLLRSRLDSLNFLEMIEGSANSETAFKEASVCQRGEGRTRLDDSLWEDVWL